MELYFVRDFMFHPHPSHPFFQSHLPACVLVKRMRPTFSLAIVVRKDEKEAAPPLLLVDGSSIFVRTSADAERGACFRFSGPAGVLRSPHECLGPAMETWNATLLPLVHAVCWSGVQATMAVVGGAGSGKWSTLLGSGSGPGLLSACANLMLANLGAGPSSRAPSQIYLELSWRALLNNEVVIDLLLPAGGEPVHGGTRAHIEDAEDAQATVQHGQAAIRALLRAGVHPDGASAPASRRPDPALPAAAHPACTCCHLTPSRAIS